ncbi:MAG: T9SS type A sorting domain-containing protein [Chitinophagaceae bacterium]|nr:T9SS type A sorting domain-containing protein [Chitinophagaceae bacterium]
MSHFEVERSFDGRDYKSIGMVFAYGNTDEKQTYTFSDKQLDMSKAGVVYYRLRSVDIDKKSEYSQVRLIHISKQGTGALSIITYPNPAVNTVSVTVPAAWQGKAISYELISQSGQLITSRKPGAASQTETFDLSRLNSGFYIIRVNCEGETVQQKIVKQ